GGIICQDYHPDGTVTITPLKLADDTRGELADSLLLFFTGTSRNAVDMLADQKARSERGDEAMLKNLEFIKSVGYETRRVLEAGDASALGRLMHEHWLRKRSRSTGMSSDRINELYEFGLAHG